MKGYLIVKEAAEKFNVTERLITQRCVEGRINGARKQGKVWLIPEDAVLPSDMRFRSGKWKDHRKKRKIRKSLKELDEFSSLGTISESAMEKALNKWCMTPITGDDLHKWSKEQIEEIKSVTDDGKRLVYKICKDCLWKNPEYNNSRHVKVMMEVQRINWHSKVQLNGSAYPVYEVVFYDNKEGIIYLSISPAFADILRRELPPDRITSLLDSNIDSLRELTYLFKSTIMEFKDELKEV